MSPQTPIYAVRSLTKSYGDNRVLDKLSFDLEHGRSLAILGRSGSGKSVLLRLLDGLEKPDGGAIFFDDEDIVPLEERELYPMRRRVGMLFQGAALFDFMPVAANLAFPLRRQTDLEEDEIQRLVDQGLERVGLTGNRDLYPASLSGGMKKRAALARSLMLQPEVMLYDEPTAGLDPVTSASIARLIRGIQDDAGVGSLVVTHDVPLARSIADEVAFLRNGRFAYRGPWDEVATCSALADFLAARETSYSLPKNTMTFGAGATPPDSRRDDESMRDIAEEEQRQRRGRPAAFYGAKPHDCDQREQTLRAAANRIVFMGGST